MWFLFLSSGFQLELITKESRNRVIPHTLTILSIAQLRQSRDARPLQNWPRLTLLLHPGNANGFHWRPRYQTFLSSSLFLVYEKNYKRIPDLKPQKLTSRGWRLALFLTNWALFSAKHLSLYSLSLLQVLISRAWQWKGCSARLGIADPFPLRLSTLLHKSYIAAVVSSSVWTADICFPFHSFLYAQGAVGPFSQLRQHRQQQDSYLSQAEQKRRSSHLSRWTNLNHYVWKFTEYYLPK